MNSHYKLVDRLITHAVNAIDRREYELADQINQMIQKHLSIAKRVDANAPLVRPF